jgi:hypothetical protein
MRVVVWRSGGGGGNSFITDFELCSIEDSEHMAQPVMPR